MGAGALGTAWIHRTITSIYFFSQLQNLPFMVEFFLIVLLFNVACQGRSIKLKSGKQGFGLLQRYLRGDKLGGVHLLLVHFLPQCLIQNMDLNKDKCLFSS